MNFIEPEYRKAHPIEPIPTPRMHAKPARKPLNARVVHRRTIPVDEDVEIRVSNYLRSILIWLWAFSQSNRKFGPNV